MAWNKLYKKSLFHNIRYPVGELYEDVVTTYKLVYSAKKIVYLDQYLYHHINRSGSLSHDISDKTIRSWFLAEIKWRDGLIVYGYPSNKLDKIMCSYALSYIFKASKKGDAVYLIAEQILENTKLKCILISKLPIKKVTLFIIWKINKEMFYKISKIAREINLVK